MIKKKDLIKKEYIYYFKCDSNINLFSINHNYNAYDVLFVTMKIIGKYEIDFFDLNELFQDEITIDKLSEKLTYFF